MKPVSMLLVLLALVMHSTALDNGLARTPPMGFNTWNHFGCDIDETLMIQTAKYMVSTGLQGVGYTYVNMDDCWQVSRDANKTIIADPVKFPNGIPYMTKAVHSLGLKFGLYSDAGFKTCAGRPASLGLEEVDAETYAAWEVDYLKYDNCNTDGSSPRLRYPAMRDALNRTGRPILFSMCEWGVEDPGYWAAEVGNTWRTTGDISDDWTSMITRADLNNRVASSAAPGGWNDPDMLEVGNGGLTYAESITHFSLWCLMKSPLLIGCDISNMTQETLNILTNKEAIAINQDALGVQGRRVWSSIDVPVALQTSALIMKPCASALQSTQTFAMESNGSIRLSASHDGRCVAIDDCGNSGLYPNHVSVGLCSPLNSCVGRNQVWHMKGEKLISNFSSQCLERSVDGLNVQTFNCSSPNDRQQWSLLADGSLRPSKDSDMCLTADVVVDAGVTEVWAGPLANGDLAVALVNRGSSSAVVTVEWSYLGLDDTNPAWVRDLWLHQDVGFFTKSYNATVESHGTVFLRLAPAN